MATKLLCKPLAEPLLDIVLRDGSVLLGIFQAVTHFIEDIKVALDVLKRAVFWELVQGGLDLLLGGGHSSIRITNTHSSSLTFTAVGPQRLKPAVFSG